MKIDFLVAGFLGGKKVEKNRHFGFDGKKLDTLFISACIMSKEECDDIIDSLLIQRHCLPSKKEKNVIR
jgi:hypothetical protein